MATPFESAVGRALEVLPRRGRYAVAYSGGGDSLALLAAMASLRGAVVERLRAVHVNHGMQPEAEAWEATCRAVCADLGVPFGVARVTVDRAGHGPEAAARRARYRALAGVLEPDEVLCTGHHRDDQVETVLLQLLRGAGPRGLAGAARWGRLGRGWLARPLLDVPRDALAAYAAESGLAWVEDPTNVDEALARARLRARVMPALREHAPGADRALGRAAAHQSACAALLDDLAEIDLETAQGATPGTLSRAACRELGEVRVANLLRFWLRRHGLPLPTERQLDQVLKGVVASRDDRVPKVGWPGAEVRRHRDALYALAPMPPVDSSLVRRWDCAAPLALPHGRLSLRPATGDGLADWVTRSGLEVRLRRGGERCRPADRAHGQSLKHAFQERGVVPWERGRLPLLYREGVLVAVPGVLVCAGYECLPGRRGHSPEWQVG